MITTPDTPAVPDQWVTAALLRLLGGTQAVTARSVGVARRTLRAWESDPRWQLAMSHARDRWLGRLIERRGRSREELQAESMAMYESILSDPEASNRDKIFARKRIDELLGLDEPRRLEHHGRGGGPIQTEVHRLAQDPALRPHLRALATAVAMREAKAHRDDSGSRTTRPTEVR